MILTTAVAVVVVAGGYWMLGGPEGKSTVDFATETVTKVMSAISLLLPEP